MDTPLAIIAYIAVSAIIALVLLIVSPLLLLDHGLDIAWIWVSILISWILIEALHAYFEDNEFDDAVDRDIVMNLRKVRAEHDSFGVGIGRSHPHWSRLVRLEQRGYLEASSYNDEINDCWWRATR